MTTTTSTMTLTDVIDAHLEAYCEPDRDRRAELLSTAWAADGQLIDPPFDGVGLEAISALTDSVLEHFPAHRFERTTEVDAHHSSARYGWALLSPEGVAAVVGTDIVEVDGSGKIQRIVGFFGDLTPS